MWKIICDLMIWSLKAKILFLSILLPVKLTDTLQSKVCNGQKWASLWFSEASFIETRFVRVFFIISD